MISHGLFCFEKNVSLEFRVYDGNGKIKLFYIFLTEVLLNYYIFQTNVLLYIYILCAANVLLI